MTTVCAVALGDRVVMGADSMTNVYDRPVLGAVKIIEVRARDVSADPEHPSVLLGFAGDGALPQLVRDGLVIESLPVEGESPHPWASAVARNITAIAVRYGVLDDGRLNGSVLLGWRGLLWTVSHQQAVPHSEGIAAIGSGEGPAMGALYALDSYPRNALGRSSELADAVRQAVAIATHLDRYSGGTPLVLSIP